MTHFIMRTTKSQLLNRATTTTVVKVASLHNIFVIFNNIVSDYKYLSTNETKKVPIVHNVIQCSVFSLQNSAKFGL